MVPFGREESQPLPIEPLRPTLPVSSILSPLAVTACKPLAPVSESTQIVSIARAPHDRRRTIWPDIIADRALCAFNRDHKDGTSGGRGADIGKPAQPRGGLVAKRAGEPLHFAVRVQTVGDFVRFI